MVEATYVGNFDLRKIHNAAYNSWPYTRRQHCLMSAVPISRIIVVVMKFSTYAIGWIASRQSHAQSLTKLALFVYRCTLWSEQSSNNRISRQMLQEMGREATNLKNGCPNGSCLKTRSAKYLKDCERTYPMERHLSVTMRFHTRWLSWRRWRWNSPII